MYSENDQTTPPEDESVFLAPFLRDLLAVRRLDRDDVLEDYLTRYPDRRKVLRQAFGEFVRAPDEDPVGDLPRDTSKKAGRVLGHYRFLHLLGSGGQGEVYLAEDSRLGRKVAVKILSAFGATSPEALARFRREVEIASHLDHPAICPVFDTGVDRGVPYFVMRHIEGEPLSRKIDTTREGAAGESLSVVHLTPDSEVTEPAEEPRAPRSGPDTEGEIRSVLILMEEAARALHAAHEAGIIHRDIKPGNIMVTPEGKPVILDFGLARETEGEGASQTLTGDLFGSPAYMSPEQLLAKRIRLDRRTDVWSLGVTLYECLALRRPFNAPTRAGLFQVIQTKDPPDPRRLNRAISADLKAVIDLALEKDRDRRYQTAELFADDLSRVLKGVPTLARPIGPVGTLLRWSRREPLKAALIVLVIVTFPAIATLVTIHVKDRPQVEAAHLARLEEEKDAILSAASYELAEGSADAALRMFEQVLALEGTSPEAAAGKVLAHLRRGEAESAQLTLDRHALLLKGSAALVLLRADVLRARHHEQDADDLLRTVPEPKGALDHHLLATRALQAGERECDAGRDGREHFLGALRHASRAVLLSGPRAVLLELRTHAAGHCRDRETAIESAAVLRERWPHAASVHYWAGFALDSLDDPALLDDVIAAYREAIRLKFDFSAVHNNLGNALQARGLLDDAIGAYREAIRLNPGNALAYSNLGSAFEAKGLLDHAIAVCREAIRVQPDHAEAHSNLGVALTGKGLLDDAIAALGEAIRLQPDYAKAHSNLGVALSEKGLLDDAIAACRKSIRLLPDYADAHNNLGNALQAKGLLDDAIAAFREAIRLRPDYALALSNLGSTLQTKGLHDDAIAALREAVRLQPGFAMAHFNLGFALEAKGLFDDANASYREAIRLKPDDAIDHYNLGNALRAKGHLDGAIAAYREAIRLKPDFAKSHYNLGVTVMAKGLLDEAIAAYREAIRHQPDHAMAHYNLGIALIAKGLPDDAIAGFRESIRLKPDYAEAYCNLGSALQIVGNHPEALAAMRRGHDLGSQFAGWSFPSADWVANVERLVQQDAGQEARLEAHLAAGTEPEDPEELAPLAKAALRTGRALIAARWYQSAFERQPGLAGDLGVRHRFHGACAAAKAAAETADVELAKSLGGQALEWLTEDLDAWEARYESGRIKEAGLRRTLSIWQNEASLSGVRGDALSSLPMPEQEAFAAFWDRVGRILADL